MSYLGSVADNTVYVKSSGLWVPKTLGSANGIPTLDGTGKVPSSQLPSSGSLPVPPASDANTIGLWQVGEGSAATTWPNHATGAGAITATMTQALANGTASAGFQPGSASLFRDLTNYPSYLSAQQEQGPRVTVTTAPSTSTAWTADFYTRMYPVNGSGHLLYGYRRTTGAVSSITATDWSFVFFIQAYSTFAYDWGFAFTVTGGTGIKETAIANFGNYLLYPNTTYHIGLIVYQSGGVTAYQLWLNGVAIRGATAVASLQTVDFVNSREVLFQAGYASYVSAFNWGQNYQLSNIQRPQSYFIDAFTRCI